MLTADPNDILEFQLNLDSTILDHDSEQNNVNSINGLNFEAKPAFRGVMENGKRLFITWMDSTSDEMKFVDDFKRIKDYFETYDEQD